MLVIVDMQNHILDPESKYYVQHADKLIKQIHSRLEAARKKTNIFFLPEIYQSSEKSRMKKAKICKSFLHLLLKKMKKSSRNTTSRCHRKAYLRLNKKLLTKMKKKSILKSLVQKRISVSYRIPLLYKAYFQKLIFSGYSFCF